jgi:hypothetical protein
MNNLIETLHQLVYDPSMELSVEQVVARLKFLQGLAEDSAAFIAPEHMMDHARYTLGCTQDEASYKLHRDVQQRLIGDTPGEAVRLFMEWEEFLSTPEQRAKQKAKTEELISAMWTVFDRSEDDE